MLGGGKIGDADMGNRPVPVNRLEVGAMESPLLAPEQADEPISVKWSPRFLHALRTRERSGQAILEFAIVSMAFLMIVFGTIDFGRAIYMYSQLQNSVREGARYGKMNPAATTAIEAVVIGNASSLNLRPDDIDVSCTGGCYPGSAAVTVKARGYFEPFTAKLLGIGKEDLPIELNSSATVTAE
jgi:hypothetical protein